ncbi:MAG: hypothetical protein M1827_002196 [Pycnora praestabilis]|nr:MAG: hypothetical protein M1827_002196 [Pycnora praestabilis]
MAPTQPHMSTRAVPSTRNGVEGYTIDGKKMWQSGMHRATHCIIFARTSDPDGSATGITAFIVPAKTLGLRIDSYEWTFSMLTDHATISLTSVFVPQTAILGALNQGLRIAQTSVHENRIRQAASSLGAAVYCIEASVTYARQRSPFGKPLAENQGIQFPLVELATQAEMLRLLIRKTALEIDALPLVDIERKAADRAMQVHGGLGYSRHKPFEHIYRHHRRYRITERSEEIQMRKTAAYLFGFVGPRKDDRYRAAK